MVPASKMSLQFCLFISLFLIVNNMYPVVEIAILSSGSLLLDEKEKDVREREGGGRGSLWPPLVSIMGEMKER